MNVKSEFYWEGRPLAELSRDELLEVIDYLANEYARNTTPQMIKAKALGMTEMLKRGERVLS